MSYEREPKGPSLYTNIIIIFELNPKIGKRRRRKEAKHENLKRK